MFLAVECLNMSGKAAGSGVSAGGSFAEMSPAEHIKALLGCFSEKKPWLDRSMLLNEPSSLE